jgi:gluconate 5-dehydrogenase
MNPFLIPDRIALVTRGSRGIGLSAARALGESGAKVILAARDAASLEAAAEDLHHAGIKAEFSSVDLSNTNGIAPWFDRCISAFGPIDILVNAAGITRRGLATELSLEDWNTTFAVNATAVFELSRCFARNAMSAGKPGKIVNIASLMTSAARKGTSAYTASKGALGQLTKALAIDWASHRILVNAIAPGYIATDLTADLAADPAFDEWVKKRCPLGRWGQPEDIAWPVVFLASPASDFMTGQIIYVDGGWLATF